MSNFIRSFWVKNSHRFNGNLIVRFPPEPNGHLHIGHAKALLVNESLAKEFGGKLIIRMDDTNPSAEKEEFRDSILEDIRWLGVEHDKKVTYASDWFKDLSDMAVLMIKNGEAYVDKRPREEIKRDRGTFVTPGVDSPFKKAKVRDNLAAFSAMLSGAEPGSMILRANLDMKDKNLVMRDPALWRVTNTVHPRTGSASLPMYDFAHPFCDVMERISLSLCSLEFEERKCLYNHIASLSKKYGYSGEYLPEEIEFARLEPDRGLTSKRKIKDAVETGKVESWSDPRLLTLKGLRAAGFGPEDIRSFVGGLGVSRAVGTVPLEGLLDAVRDRAGVEKHTVVVDPVPLFLTAEDGSVSTLYVERSDVSLTPSPDFYRLAKGNTVRLMGLNGFVVVEDVVLSDDGLSVLGFFDRKGKARATVHTLDVSGKKTKVMHSVFWDGEENPALCLSSRPALLDTSCAVPMDLFHAPRVGWMRMEENGNVRLVAKIKNKY